MANVTVPGASYTSEPIPSGNTIHQLACEIARALELEAYTAMRHTFHHHRRHNTADSAAEHDAAYHAWVEAQTARDYAEDTYP